MGIFMHLNSSPTLGVCVSQGFTNIGCVSKVHQHWVCLKGTPTLGVSQGYTNIGFVSRVHQHWVCLKGTPTLGVSQGYTNIG